MWFLFKEISGAEKMAQVDKSAYCRRITAYTQISRTHKKCLSTYNSSTLGGAQTRAPLQLGGCLARPKVIERSCR